MKAGRIRLLVIAGLAISLTSSMAGTVLAQIVRPPELNMQFHRAETAWKSGTSLLEAKARVDRVLKSLPDDAEARKLRAEVFIALNRPSEAVDDAQHAVRLNPRDGVAQLILSEAARLSGKRALALQSMDAASEYLPEDAGLHIRLSWNAMQLRELEKAEAFARIALALKPSEPAAYQQLARVFVLQNRQEEAVEIVVRGLRGAVLSMEAIERDSLLSRVARHPLLERVRR